MEKVLSGETAPNKKQKLSCLFVLCLGHFSFLFPEKLLRVTQHNRKSKKVQNMYHHLVENGEFIYLLPIVLFNCKI